VSLVGSGTCRHIKCSSCLCGPSAVVHTIRSESPDIENALGIPTILSLRPHQPYVVDRYFDGDVLVQSGTVRMTLPSEEGDIALRGGERRRVRKAAGVVIQAIQTGAHVVLVPVVDVSWKSPLRRSMEGSIR
jgi:hypothetical protein